MKKNFLLIAMLGIINFQLYASLTSDTLNLYDSTRSREIPIQMIANDNCNNKVVIVNHGYGVNKGGDYLKYSHITNHLATEGYYVISIQHELPDDPLLTMEGDLYQNRMPNWIRGVENISFVINEIKNRRPDLDWNALTLIGHSNGGDMVMLFATQYPESVSKAISLDHRRMPIPRTSEVKLCSLRGCDYPADKGVLPSAKECKKHNIRIIKLKNIKHSDMDDKASEKQSNTINRYISDFIKE